MSILTIEDYSKKIGVSVMDIIGKSRKQKFTVPRFMYWYYLNKVNSTFYTQMQLARQFNRAPKSIRNGIQQIKNFKDTKDSIIDPYKEVIEPFLHQSPSN